MALKTADPSETAPALREREGQGVELKSRQYQGGALGLVGLYAVAIAIFSYLSGRVERPGLLALAVGVGLTVGALTQRRRVKWVGEGRTVLSEAICGLLLLVPMGALTLAWQLFGFPQPHAAALVVEHMSAATLVGVVAFVALFEEVLFRGALMEEMKAQGSNAMAVGVTAILFGAVHAFMSVSIASLVYFSIVGIVMALLVLWRGGILAGLVLHLLWNLGMIVMFLSLGLR